MGRVTARRKVVRIRDGAVDQRPDTLAVEEPMEIRVGGRPLTITMRTPGDDFDLAVGFLVSEGDARRSDRRQGHIAETTPAAGSPLTRNSTVTIYPSRG